MIHLLKADFYRVRKAKLGYISAIVLFLFGLLLGLLGDGYTATEIIESTLSSGSIFMPIMLTNILMIAWGHEFSYRTVNNVLISGTSRLKYFISKFTLTMILTVVFLAIYGVSIMVSTLLFRGSVDVVYTFQILFAQFPLYMAVMSLGILLFNVFNTTYVAITIFLVISFVGDNILSMIIMTYLKNMDFLIDHLFLSNIGNMARISLLSTNMIMTYILSAVSFALVFIIGSYQIFRNREFK